MTRANGKPRRHFGSIPSIYCDSRLYSRENPSFSVGQKGEPISKKDFMRRNRGIRPQTRETCVSSCLVTWPSHWLVLKAHREKKNSRVIISLKYGHCSMFMHRKIKSWWFHRLKSFLSHWTGIWVKVDNSISSSCFERTLPLMFTFNFPSFMNAKKLIPARR